MNTKKPLEIMDATPCKDNDSFSRGSVENPKLGYVDLDDAVLGANGHKAEMRRQFNWISALGLGFSITNSWAGYLVIHLSSAIGLANADSYVQSCFGQNMIYGGPQSVIFGLLVAFFVQWIVTIGLSELGSAFPVSPTSVAIMNVSTHGYHSPAADSITFAIFSALRRTNDLLLLSSDGSRFWLGGLSRKYQHLSGRSRH